MGLWGCFVELLGGNLLEVGIYPYKHDRFDDALGEGDQGEATPSALGR